MSVQHNLNWLNIVCLRRCAYGVFSLIFLLVVSGCTNKNQLSPSPNLFIDTAGGYPDDQIPISERSTRAELLYITDRIGTNSPTLGVSYGLQRSSSMALGRISIRYGDKDDWQSLKQASQTSSRKQNIKLKIENVEELVRFPETPLPFEVTNGRLNTIPEAQEQYGQKESELRGVFSARLAKTIKKEAFIFVPGFNNSFEDGTLSLANIWHLSGRVGIPVLYSWPAGHSGFSGYLKDREAGEFSIFHLKQFIEMLARIPELERIHIIAHSRGTDVVTSALRELVIAERAKGNSPRESLKISNLILAAPDLDFGIVRQRLIAERFGPAIGHISVYVNPGDGALRFSQRLATGTRFGRLTVDDLNESDRRVFEKIRNVSFIEIENPGGGIGHSYFRDNPSVLSDIAISVMNNVPPGHEKRPLEFVGINFWLLKDGYPFSD